MGCNLWAGGVLEQIQLLLDHASVQTTERYRGSEQNLSVAVNGSRWIGKLWPKNGPHLIQPPEHELVGAEPGMKTNQRFESVRVERYIARTTLPVIKDIAVTASEVSEFLNYSRLVRAAGICIGTRKLLARRYS